MQILEQVNIFNAFHDGSLHFLQRRGNDIDFQIEIPYIAEMFDPTFTNFYGVLKSCDNCRFECWDEKRTYKNIEDINASITDMEILEARHKDNHVCISFLDGSKSTGGYLVFSCQEILLFDNRRKSWTPAELQEIVQRYWSDFSRR